MSNAFITLNDKAVVDPRELYREANRLGVDLPNDALRANSFTLSRGKEPANGWILLRKSDFPSTLDSISLDLRFVVDDKPGKGAITFRDLCVWSVYAVLAGSSEDDSVFLLQLCDRRVLAHLSAVNRAYNLWEPDGTLFYTSQDSGSDWTWDSILEDLWDALPSAVGAYPGTTGLTFPEETPHYQFWGWNAWDAINRVLEDTGHTITRELDEVSAGVWQTGDLKIVAKSDTDTVISQELTKALKDGLVEHTHPQDVTKASIPATFRIFRPKRDYSFQNDHSSEPTWGDKHKNDCTYSSDVATASLDSSVSTVAETVYPIWDSYPAVYDEDGSLENGTEISNRASTLANLHLSALLLEDRDNTFTGLWRLYPGKVLSSVLFHDFGDGIFTQITAEGLTRAPANTDPYSRPSIVEPSIPYDRWFIGEITGGSIAAGSNGTAKVLYGSIGTSGNIAWSQKSTDTEPVHNAASSRTYNNAERVVCKYHWQTQRWLILDETGDPGSSPMKIIKIYGVNDECDTIADDADCVWAGKIVTGTTSGSMCGFPNTEGDDVWVTCLNQCPTPLVLKIGELYIGFKVTDSYTYNEHADRPLYAIRKPPAETAVVRVTGESPGSFTSCYHDVDEIGKCAYQGKRLEPDYQASGQLPSDMCDADAWQEVEDIWIVGVNQCNHMRELRVGEQYMGTCMGYLINGAVKYPCYAVRHEETSVYLFEANSSGVYSNNVYDVQTSDLHYPDGTDTLKGPNIVDHTTWNTDTLNLFPRVRNNSRGVCVYVGSTSNAVTPQDEWHIVNVQQEAIIVEVELNAHLTPGDNTISTTYRRTLSPSPFNIAPSAVNNCNNRFKLRGTSGTRALAFYDKDATGSGDLTYDWTIFQVEGGCGPLLWRANITSTSTEYPPDVSALPWGSEVVTSANYPLGFTHNTGTYETTFTKVGWYDIRISIRLQAGTNSGTGTNTTFTLELDFDTGGGYSGETLSQRSVYIGNDGASSSLFLDYAGLEMQYLKQITVANTKMRTNFRRDGGNQAVKVIQGSLFIQPVNYA